jgi:hypothetical protein
VNDIADFLRARYMETREDIQRGYLHAPEIADYTGWDKRTVAGLPPAVAALVIADLDAKLSLVEEHTSGGHYWPDSLRQYCKTCGSGEPHEYPTDWPCRTIRILAHPFARHPHHKGEEWAP